MKKKDYIITIVGLGYVGLPLAIKLSKHFKVFGFDKSYYRINNLKKNIDITNEVSKADLKKSKKITFTNKVEDIKTSNIYIVSVPTPITKNLLPDLSLIINATKTICKVIKKQDIIIYESTVYPGVTEDICAKLIERITKLKFNKDFFCSYSPERINPGDKKRTIDKIVKVVSGSNLNTLNKVSSIYKKIIKAGIYKAESIKIAEAAKVIENTQRDLNIAFMNELKKIFDKMSLNTNQILKAASTKWNFAKFTPGLVGGHCIGVDPYYLTYIAKKNNINPKIILAGRSINENMGTYFFKKYLNAIKLKFKKKNINLLFLGASFKEDCGDFRNSKLINIYSKIKKFYNADIFDPLINKKDFEKFYKIKINNVNKKKYDVIICGVGHTFFKKIGLKNLTKKYLRKQYLFFDLKNIFGSKEMYENK